MEKSILYDKIYAGWVGKNIGVILGTPVESCREVMHLTGYLQADHGGINQWLLSDLLLYDLQLLNLHAIEMYGTRVSTAHIAAEWNEHCYFPWDEYGHATTAMRYGFKPPFSGMFDNHFTNCMGCPIRSEVWAAIAAGNPRLAAYFAWQDAVVDHAGGEGVFGEIFNAAFEAAAFESTDIPAIIREALTYIPSTSRVYGAVSLMLSLYEQGMELLDARAEVLEKYGNPNFTDAPQNIAFGIAGLLWGKDFEDAILKVVNLGYDTDCTVATCAAMWGILYGRASIPEKWSQPVSHEIRLSPSVRGFKAPANLDELTRRCIALYDMLRYENTDMFVITEEDTSDFAVQHYTLPEGARRNEAFCVDLRYENGDPTIAPERPHTLEATLTNNTTWPWTREAFVECPYGLTAEEPVLLSVAPGESVVYRTTVTAGPHVYYHIPVDRVYPISLAIKRLNCGDCWRIYRLPVTLLAPNRWKLNGKPTLIPAATVQFSEPSEDGVYVAEATLCTPPVSRKTRITCNCTWPTTVEIDGKVIIHTDTISSFVPAYHRTPGDQLWEGTMEAGIYKVKVTIRMPKDAQDVLPMFVMSINATGEVSEPGNWYAYIDDHFAR